MSQSKIFLLKVLNTSGETHAIGFTRSEEFAKDWYEKDTYCREYEELDEVVEIPMRFAFGKWV